MQSQATVLSPVFISSEFHSPPKFPSMAEWVPPVQVRPNRELQQVHCGMCFGVVADAKPQQLSSSRESRFIESPH